MHTKTQVTGVGPGWVEANGKRIEAAVTLWAAGVQASPLGKMLGAPTRQARLRAWSTTTSIRRGCLRSSSSATSPTSSRTATRFPAWPSRPCRWAITSAKSSPPTSPDKPRPAFRYFDKGDMATIGRMAAVAKVEWPFKAHMSGFPAWFTWLTVHIFFLIGFRNRLSVLASWTWTYFTFTRGARLITGDQTCPAGRRNSQNRSRRESCGLKGSC